MKSKINNKAAFFLSLVDIAGSMVVGFIIVIIAGILYAENSIDLKTLIGEPKEVALRRLSDWGIKVSSSDLSGYNKGIQIEVKNGKVSTIWIEFTDRRTGAFPHQVDNVVTQNVDIQKVIEAYGYPDKTGEGTKIGDTILGGWKKWITDSYQLHCEVIDSKVVMVTIIEPDWFPGKDL